jgi:hypothetical protein
MKRGGSSSLGAATLLLLGLLAGVARAEEPKSEAAADVPTDATSSPDVVRLKNGGMVRGKINELIPGDTVTIVTIAGATRQFKMSEVDYAGLAATDPQAAPTLPAPAGGAPAEAPKKDSPQPYMKVRSGEAILHLESAPGLTFLRQSTSAVVVGLRNSAIAAGYERMCTAPCQISLPAGTETLALSRDGALPIGAQAVTLPVGVSRVKGAIDSRSGMRGAGWGVMLGSLALATYLVIDARGERKDCVNGVCHDSDTLDKGQVAAGLIVGAVGFGLGLGMASVPDRAVFTVQPVNGAVSRPIAHARGVTFSSRF